jgi:tape measure domain-containing protein
MAGFQTGPDGTTARIGIEAEGNFASLEKALTSAISSAMANASSEIVREIQAAFRKVGQSAEKDLNLAATVDRQAKKVQDSTRRMQASFDALAASSAGIAGAFGESFDPRIIKAFDDQLKRVVELQEELRAGAGNLGDAEYKQLTDQTKLLATGLISARNAAESAKRAIDEANRNVSRDGRQVSREKIATIRAESARFAVEQQSQASAARDAARQQVEASRSSSRQRVAIIQAAARTIATIERGLSTVFRGTAQAVGAAFNGIGRIASGAASTISSAFRRSGSDINNTYNQSFSRSTKTVQNELNQQTTAINNFTRNATSQISSLGGLSGGAKFGVGAAIGGILGIGAAKALSGGFERAANLEDSLRSLTVLLGDATKAGELLDGVLEVVRGTPFRLDQFALAATQLSAFGVEAKAIPPILQTIADAAAVRGGAAGETIDRFVRIVGQISAAGRIMTEDLNQFTESGIPALRILGNAFGKTELEIREMATKGLLPAEEALAALIKGINEGTDGVNAATPAFAGLSKELGGTLRGSLANFSTAFSRLGANIIKEFTPVFTAAIGAATEAVDLLGSALKSVAAAVVSSPTYRLLGRVFESLAGAIKKAGDQLKPVFDFLAGGLVLLGQAALGLFALKSIPVVLRALGSAIKFILAPKRLLIAGLILTASYFKKLYDDSKDLRAALVEVGRVVRRIAIVVRDVAVEAFEAFAGGIQTGGGEARTFARTVLETVVPAVEGLADFLLTKVLPPIRDFAKFLRTEVIPVLGEAFATAVGVARRALTGFANIVGGALGEVVRFARVAYDILVLGGTAGGMRAGGGGWLAYDGPIAQGLNSIRNLLSEVVQFFKAAATILWSGEEFTEGTGWLSEDGLVVRGLKNIRSKMEAVVEYIKSDFRPVLVGLGAALGVLALSGGSIPLAGLAGLTAGIVTALSNEEVRNALVDNIGKAVDSAKEKLKELFDGDTLKDIGVGALKVANEIGKVLGNIVSDPRLLAGIAAIAAAGAALAASFAVGFVEGLLSNIPEIAKGINAAVTKALVEGLKAAASNPLLAGAGLVLFGSGLFLRGVAKAGRSAVIEFNRAASLGPGNQFRPQAGSATSFVRALIGGPDAIAKNVEQQFKEAQAVTIREGQRLQRIAQQVQGSTIRNEKGQFLSPKDTAAIARGYDEMAKAVGSTNLAAGQLKAGIGQVANAFGKSQNRLDDFRDGLRSIGQGAKTAFQEYGAKAGIAAGAAFAGAFLAKAAFDVESTGAQKLQGVVGALGAGFATLASTKSAPLAAGVTVVSLLGGAFLASKEKADRLKQAVKELGLELANLDPDEASKKIDDTLLQAFLDVGGETKDLLNDLRIDYLSFSEALQNDDGVAFIARRFEQLGPAGREFGAALREGEITLGRIDNAIRGASEYRPFFDVGALQGEIRAYGFEVGTFADGMGFLGEQTKLVAGAFVDAERNARVMNAQFDEVGRTGRGMDYLRERMVITGEATKATEAAAKAYNETLSELNNVRIEGLKIKVDEAKGALDRARDSAKEALQAALDFFTGGSTADTFKVAVDRSTISVASLAAGMSGLKDDAPAFQASWDTALRNIASEAETVLARGIEDGLIFDQVSAAVALQPLIDAIAATGGPGATEALAILQEIIGKFALPDGTNLLKGAIASDGLVDEADAAVDTAISMLETGKDLPADLFVLNVEAAKTAGLSAAQDIIDGWVEKFAGNTQMQDALAAQGKNIIADFDVSLGNSSPSKKTAESGKYAIQGFVKGISAGNAQVMNATRAVGFNAMLGLRQGIQLGAASAISAAWVVANQIIAIMKFALQEQSPSRVTREIGEYFSEGLAEGIADSAPAALGAAVALANKALSGLSNVGKKAAKAFGKGFAEQGPSFINSIGSTLDEALNEALSRVDMFKAAGLKIASALFSRQGFNAAGVPGGGSAATTLQLGRLQARFIPQTARDNFSKLVEMFGPAARRFDSSPLGAVNQAEFLMRGSDIRDFIQLLLDSGVGIEAASREGKVLRDNLVAVARAAGATTAQINSMLTTLGLTNTQLADLAKTTNAVAAATRAATEAEEERIREEERREAAAKKADEDAAAAREADERARREYTFRSPVFRDLIVQSPSGNPEAVALATANKVAFSVRR